MFQGMFFLVFFLAENLPTVGAPWNYLLSYGMVGLVLLAFLTGYIHTKWDYDAITKDRDAARLDRDKERDYTKELEKKIRDDIVPLLTKVYESTVDAARLITEARTEMNMRDRRGE